MAHSDIPKGKLCLVPLGVVAVHCKGNMQPCQVFAWGESVSQKYADISIGCGAKTKQKRNKKGVWKSLVLIILMFN